MAYSLSFTDEFFWGDSEYPEKTNKPRSLYDAFYNLWLNDRKEFNEIVSDVLGQDISMYDCLPETTINELVEKVKEYNTCVNITVPVEVYINDCRTILVY